MGRLWGVAAALALLWAFYGHVDTSYADHNGALLPLVPNTPLMQTIKASQSYTWCANSTAANYPNFVAQVVDVADRYYERTGIRADQVAYGAGCQVKHDMVSGLACGGCAAHIFYANWPVVVEYKAEMGFQDWRSTIGHELGHGVLGLHEQYNDRNFTCLTDRTWTVMSCGTNVRYPQPFDVSAGCGALATAWCGVPVACDPCWSGSRWIFSSLWAYEPSTDVWYDPLARLYWHARDQFGWRFTPVRNEALPGGAVYWTPELGHNLVP